MTTDRDFRVAEAIKFVESGSSQVDAAGGWAVTRSTLQRHLKGGLTMKEAKEPFQRLSAIQEGFVADWILVEEEAGRTPNKRIVREFAEMMLPPDEDPPRLGKHWIEGFLRRNPTVSTKIGRPLEAARAKKASKAKIEAFYERLRGLIARHDIKPSGITNMDETGVQERESVAGKVVGSALTKHTEVKKSDCTTWVTIIEGITANGRRLTPAVIFTGGSLQGQWFPPEIKPWKYDYSPLGWSNGEIALKWFKEVYLPETKPENNEGWRLLVLD